MTWPSFVSVEIEALFHEAQRYEGIRRQIEELPNEIDLEEEPPFGWPGPARRRPRRTPFFRRRKRSVRR